jgi:transcriptional regulator GlxA family with amidase domain
MPVEHDVQFVNIDLLLVGAFDRSSLLAALGDGVFVLHDSAQFEGEECCGHARKRGSRKRGGSTPRGER